KPYTLTPASADPAGAAVQVATLDDTRAAHLIRVATTGHQIRLGRTRTTLTRPPRRVDRLDWAAPPAGGRRAWVLRFVTPTTFRRGNTFTPTPSLHSILTSLHRTWNTHAPDRCRLPQPDTSAVQLTDIDVTSHLLHVNQVTVSGFTGRLRFTTIPDTPASTAELISRLVAWAPFAGVGAYTTRGLGVTRTEPTWPAPRRPADDTAPARR
ncbi:CRISPR system precrRNA processing endoribonuclease RAMP protein Cas6, partial [Mangrovihabitans endophyticus]|uniref:CRISPR system precrRNA processing endoribonuclease RAMP protein Cas6 n=1 Tax=Mangrovihabitans endophyticus TaxID=1751298 RepID=UPI00166690A6